MKKYIVKLKTGEEILIEPSSPPSLCREYNSGRLVLEIYPGQIDYLEVSAWYPVLESSPDPVI